LLSLWIISNCSPEAKTVTLKERFKGMDFATVLPQIKPIKTVNGLTIGVKAKDCGRCHIEIYREWKQSTHATALQDIQFQAEIAKNDSPKWLCLNCHIPMQNQRKYLVSPNTLLEDKKDDIRFLDKKTNPDFDSVMQRESITCAVCHVRKNENGDSYIIGSHGNSYAPHPVKVNKTYLRNFCQRCHSPGAYQLTKTFICWFETSNELKNGPYANNKDCVDCHMPQKKRPLVVGFPKRNSSQHYWAGGGVPKWFKDYDTLIARGYKPALEVMIKDIFRVDSGKNLNVKLKYKNAKAGHWLPTGDPERFILLRASLENRDGAELSFKKHRLEQVWDWGDLKTGRTAKKLSDNRLKPLEEREWVFTLPLPENIEGIKLNITAYHVRLSTETAQYMMMTPAIDETYLKNGQHRVNNAHQYYPFVSYIFKENVELKSGVRRQYTVDELIKLSKKEQGKKLSERIY